MFKKKLLGMFAAILLLPCFFLFGCNEVETTISITAENNTIFMGKNYELSSSNTAVNVTYKVTAGMQNVTLDGNVLSVLKTAEENAVVRVTAEAENLVVNTLSLTVKHIEAFEISINNLPESILVNSPVTLVTSAMPADATRPVTYTITEGRAYASIVNGALTVNDSAVSGDVVKIKAKIGNVESEEYTINVISASDLNNIIFDGASNNVQTLDAALSATYTPVLKALVNGKYTTIPTESVDLSLSDASVATINSNNTLSLTGHGNVRLTATINVSEGSQVEKAVTLTVLNPASMSNSLNYSKDLTYAYSTSYALPEFAPVFQANTTKCTDYSLTINNELGIVAKFDVIGGVVTDVENANNVVYADNTLSGLAAGNYTATFATLSGSSKESTVAINFEINNGVDVSTEAELIAAFAEYNSNVSEFNLDNKTSAEIATLKQNYENKNITVNILNNIVYSSYFELSSVVNTTLNGNGFVIDTSKIDLLPGQAGIQNSRLKYVAGGATNGFVNTTNEALGEESLSQIQILEFRAPNNQFVQNVDIKNLDFKGGFANTSARGIANQLQISSSATDSEISEILANLYTPQTRKMTYESVIYVENPIGDHANGVAYTNLNVNNVDIENLTTGFKLNYVANGSTPASIENVKTENMLQFGIIAYNSSINVKNFTSINVPNTFNYEEKHKTLYHATEKETFEGEEIFKVLGYEIECYGAFTATTGIHLLEGISNYNTGASQSYLLSQLLVGDETTAQIIDGLGGLSGILDLYFGLITDQEIANIDNQTGLSQAEKTAAKEKVRSFITNIKGNNGDNPIFNLASVYSTRVPDHFIVDEARPELEMGMVNYSISSNEGKILEVNSDTMKMGIVTDYKYIELKLIELINIVPMATITPLLEAANVSSQMFNEFVHAMNPILILENLNYEV